MEHSYSRRGFLAAGRGACRHQMGAPERIGGYRHCLHDGPRQFEENLRAMAEPYSEKDEKLLAQQLARIAPIYCRMCGSCTGVCERGVPVPDMLRFLSYAEGYGQFAMARERFLELPARVRAIRCTDCVSCSVDCPNGVRVRERVSRVQELFA